MIFVTMVEFGKWIQNEINRRGWTQADLARGQLALDRQKRAKFAF